MIPTMTAQARLVWSLRTTKLFAVLILAVLAGGCWNNVAQTAQGAEADVTDLFIFADFALVAIVFAAGLLAGADWAHRSVSWEFLSSPHRARHGVVRAGIITVGALLVATLGVVLAIGGVVAVGGRLSTDAGAFASWAALPYGTWLLGAVLAALLAPVLGRALAIGLVIGDLVVIEPHLDNLDAPWMHTIAAYFPWHTLARACQATSWQQVVGPVAWLGIILGAVLAVQVVVLRRHSIN